MICEASASQKCASFMGEILFEVLRIIGKILFEALRIIGELKRLVPFVIDVAIDNLSHSNKSALRVPSNQVYCHFIAKYIS